MRRACVYCGSSTGNIPAYADAAKALGETLVQHKLDLVYGGGNIGIMRTIADSVLASGGKAICIIPQSLADREVAHHGLTELQITDSMHTRKSRMADLSDAFIALPGGLGTLEEIFEMWTWTQLGFHQKPIGLLNTRGYFDDLLHFLDKTVERGFVKPAHRAMLIVAADPETLVNQLMDYTPPSVDKLLSNTGPALSH